MWPTTTKKNRDDKLLSFKGYRSNLTPDNVNEVYFSIPV
jgi:hypothetical protein